MPPTTEVVREIELTVGFSVLADEMLVFIVVVVVFITVLMPSKNAFVWTRVLLVAGKSGFSVRVCSKLVVAFDETAVPLLRAFIVVVCIGCDPFASFVLLITLGAAVVAVTHGHSRNPDPLHSAVHFREFGDFLLNTHFT